MIEGLTTKWALRCRDWAERRSHWVNAARLGGGTAVGQGFVLLATPAITRLYLPSEIGLVQLFSSFLLLASTLASLRYEGAIAVAPANERDVLALLSCWLTLPVGLLSAGTLAALIATATLGFGELPYWSLPAMLVLVMVTGVFAVLRSWFVARKDFTQIASALVRQGVGRALFPILVAPLGLGWVGLLAGEAAGRGLGLSDFLRKAGPALVAAHHLGPRRLQQCFLRYRQFPLSYVPGVLLDAIASGLPFPLVVSFFGISAAGLFALAQRVILLPSALICGALADVCQARLVDAALNDPNSVPALVRSTALRLAGAATALYVPIAGLALISFRWVFGAKWGEAGAVAAALAPFAISGVMTNPLSRALLISRVPQLKLLSDAFRVALPSGGLYVAGHARLSLVSSTLLFAFLGMVADCIYMGVIWYCVAPSRQRQLTPVQTNS